MSDVRYFFDLLYLTAPPFLAGPLIKYFKSQGCAVIHKCTTIRHAKVR